MFGSFANDTLFFISDEFSKKARESALPTEHSLYRAAVSHTEEDAVMRTSYAGNRHT